MKKKKNERAGQRRWTFAMQAQRTRKKILF